MKVQLFLVRISSAVPSLRVDDRRICAGNLWSLRFRQVIEHVAIGVGEILLRDPLNVCRCYGQESLEISIDAIRVTEQHRRLSQCLALTKTGFTTAQLARYDLILRFLEFRI